MAQELLIHYWVPVSIAKISDLLFNSLQLFLKIDIILSNDRLNDMDTSYIYIKLQLQCLSILFLEWF